MPVENKELLRAWNIKYINCIEAGGHRGALTSFEMFRLNKLRVFVDIFDELILILAHLKKPVAFFEFLNIPKLAGLSFLLGDKPLLGNRIPPLIFIIINVPSVIDLLQYRLYDFRVALLCCPNKIIILNLKMPPEFHKARGKFITVLLRGHPAFLGSLLHLLAVLIQAR